MDISNYALIFKKKLIEYLMRFKEKTEYIKMHFNPSTYFYIVLTEFKSTYGNPHSKKNTRLILVSVF